MKRFQPPAELGKADVAGIAGLPTLPEISSHDYDADDQSEETSDFGGAQGNCPINVKQTEFSLKQFANMMGQANFSFFNKWKKVWVAEFTEKRHQSSIQGQNRLKQLRDGPLHWETAVADFLLTF